MTTPAEVVARRVAERDHRLAEARRFAEQLDPEWGVCAVVVFGSVARGDFHTSSDVDVLVIADAAPRDALTRQRRLPAGPPGVSPMVWSPAEWHSERLRANPVAVDAAENGVWLDGDPSVV